MITIELNGGFKLVLNGKVLGSGMVTPITLDFCYECLFGPNIPEAYENLLLDAVRGDQYAFIRADEIEHSWKAIDAITKRKNLLVSYTRGTVPAVAQEFIEKDGRAWQGL